MKKIGLLFFKLWRPAILLLAIAVLAYVLFFHNLAHFLPGYSSREINAYNSSNGIRTIADHPIGAPFKLIVYVVMKMGHHTVLVTRYVAASFAVVACFLFFMIARRWFSYRIAFLVTILFASSSGFLHIARLGSQLVLQMGVLLVIGALLWWQSTKRSTFVGFCVVVTFAALWYVPGMIWFEILALITMQHKIRTSLTTISWKKQAIGAFLFLLIITPFIRAAIIFPSNLLTFAGLPAQFTSITAILANLRDSLLSVAVHSNGSPELWLGHAPILDAIELITLLLGIYVYARRKPRTRSIFLLAATLLSLVLIGLGGSVNISSLIPFLYLVIGAGFYELMQQWLRVFPRNPFAKFTGVFCVCLLVFFSAMYQYRAYFVAWPNNTATHITFSHQHP